MVVGGWVALCRTGWGGCGGAAKPGGGSGSSGVSPERCKIRSNWLDGESRQRCVAISGRLRSHGSTVTASRELTPHSAVEFARRLCSGSCSVQEGPAPGVPDSAARGPAAVCRFDTARIGRKVIQTQRLRAQKRLRWYARCSVQHGSVSVSFSPVAGVPTQAWGGRFILHISLGVGDCWQKFKDYRYKRRLFCGVRASGVCCIGALREPIRGARWLFFSRIGC